ncbi:MAG: 4Fe-4S dicluster domain-containing protein, partial [Oscillospiraceae bacterium]|nr:4Fe-4S dicluster domain-containing protein [Oscillospiraceae bacterium]
VNACIDSVVVHLNNVVALLAVGLGSSVLHVLDSFIGGDDVSELEECRLEDGVQAVAETDLLSKLNSVDGVELAKEIGLGNRLNTILQSAFFKLANIIPSEDAIKYMKEAATKSYGKKGDDVVKMNHDAIDAGVNGASQVAVPESWKTATGAIQYPVATGSNEALVKYVNEVMIPANAQKGYDLPVSKMLDTVDGIMPLGTSAFEKRGVAVDVPAWDPDNCIQCGFCSYVCPHAVIRPIALNAEQAAAAPAEQKLVDMTGMPGYKFGITVSALDCLGCASCVTVCPGKKGVKALSMQSLESQMPAQKGFAFGVDVDIDQAVLDKFKVNTVKGSQFRQPMLEFSGACAGCGETPYAKLITQMFGDRMYIANATGCSSIWGGSAPSFPYTTNKQGKGPAWGNSLFEDNAEFGFGIFLGQKALHDKVVAKVEKLAETADAELKAAIDEYLATKTDSTANAAPAEKLIATLEAKGVGADILAEKDYLAKKSVFIFGGDGWAYDIGYGGLDHVLAQNENVNIVVFDTEVYSNTGGQSSKATPTGAVAQFAAAGKEVKKKDLAAIAMSYGYIYVAQVAMGADYAQTAKAIAEAEAYDGPSLVICYAPCINHGIKGGMATAQTEIKKAVEAGYWHTFRYDPRLAAEGKNPFQLDSKEPTGDYASFIKNEVRYTSLERAFPDRAKDLFEKAAEGAKAKYAALVEKAK